MTRARPRRITGTHVYGFGQCAHAVTLDFHGDRTLRRAPTEVEEFVLRRGRELEARLVADLGYPEPEYPERDFAAGAQATLGLLRDGVPGVSQGVLLQETRLGIPDLLRREPGASELGDHHYVVGDIKSSAEPRSDQVLQVLFYTRMLEGLQGRAPQYTYLLLRDGREERFCPDDYAAVLDDVEARIAAQRAGEVVTRPFLSSACRGCRWSEVCLPELEAADDLSLLQGMTRGLRSTLEAGGLNSSAALRELGAVEPVVRRTHVERAALERLRKAARARAARAAVAEPVASAPRADNAAVVHLLTDPFAERVHWIGVRCPAVEGGELLEAHPAKRDAELSALLGLLERVPARSALWHYGGALPRWFEDRSWGKPGSGPIARRMVDLARRLRGAACYPAPVFGLDDHVRQLLDRDPHRAGERGAVGLWVEAGEAAARLPAKGRADLDDLCALLRWLTRDEAREGTVGFVARAEAD